MLSMIYGFILLFSQGWLVLSSPAKYDQRQEGGINVQVDLKDVKIIALFNSDMLDDYTNYDYAYDYADFTLKPIVKPTTNSPETTISIESTESSTASSSTIENKTTESVSTTTNMTSIDNHQILENSTLLNESNIDETILTESKVDDKSNEKEQSLTTEVLTENPVINQKQTKRCKKFDKSGRCQRRRMSFIPLAMKIAPKLVQSVRKQMSL